MRFVGIEFDNKVNNSHIEGYAIIPENLSSIWQVGFRKYLFNTYKAQNISIYNLSVASGVNATDYMLSLKGKTNLEEDLDKAITCTKAFPRNDENDSLRRQWQSMYSLNHKYI